MVDFMTTLLRAIWITDNLTSGAMKHCTTRYVKIDNFMITMHNDFSMKFIGANLTEEETKKTTVGLIWY